jgi:hypothetical protein
MKEREMNDDWNGRKKNPTDSVQIKTNPND